MFVSVCLILCGFRQVAVMKVPRQNLCSYSCFRKVKVMILQQDKFEAFKNVTPSLLLTGHIVWRLSDFEAKMNDAKENDTVLHSPVFYSSAYGYKLRVNICVPHSLKHVLSCTAQTLGS